MSGTRSPSPRAPATEALIVAHGQPSDPDPAEAETASLAARVGRLLPGVRVRGVTLAMPGALDRALQDAAVPPVIYPLFMSEGWFTTDELPRRLGSRASRVLAPLGVDPGLVGLAGDEIARLAAERGWALDRVVLVLAAHGSGRSETSARAARRFAARLGRRLAPAEIRIGYVEQAPLVRDAARGAGPRAICLPFFAARGDHVTGDIPGALDEAGFAGILADPIGAHPGVPAMIAGRLAEARARPGREPPAALAAFAAGA